MQALTAADLIGHIRRLRLLEAEQDHALAADPAAPRRDPYELLADLRSRGWLTRYQVERLQSGQVESLKLGPYLLIDLLGEGGMGQVFKARHQSMRRVVVLKVIREELKGVEKIARRFGREIQAAARLSHPNIVTAYEAGAVGDVEYFAMEYVDGLDLGRLVLRDGPLPVRAACEYVRQAALGLQHAHEHGMVHRDIKPDNFLLSRKDGVVKLLDLGLCRLHDSPNNVSAALTVRGTALGTPEYMAPEQIRDSTSVDIRADLYSLGCTFWYLLAGRDAFTARTPTEVMYQQIKKDAVPIEEVRPEVPPAVGAILRKLMAKSPAERYQTPAELADALDRLLNTSGGQTAPTSPPAAPPPRRPTRGPTAPPAPRTETAPPARRAVTPRPPESRLLLWLALALVGGAVVGTLGVLALRAFH